MRPYVLRLLLLAMLLSAASPLAPATPASAQGVNKSTPFAVAGPVGNRVRTDEIDAYVGLMREAGVQWNREEIFWDKIQTQPGGPFQWGGDASGLYNYDKAIGAQQAAGIQMLGLLDYNPAWFKGQNPPVDAWIADWGNYVYETVARYGRGGPIRYWEIWNEPNLSPSGYESGLYTIQDYIRILGTARDAARAADPDAVIVLGGLASVWSYPPSPTTYDYFDYLTQVGELGGWEFFDIVAVHPYRPDSPEGSPWRRDHPQTFAEELRRLDAIIQRFGRKPIWLTEMGWATNRGFPGVSEDTQAQFLVRATITALAHPSVEKIFWYTFRDDNQPGAPYDRPVYNPTYHELNYGLIRRTYPLDANAPRLRKPGFVAYRTMTGMLAGLALQQTLADGLRSDMPATYWYRFGGNRRIDVLWNTDSPRQAVTIACGCREALVRRWNGEARYLLPASNGNLSLVLDEQGSPVYVEFDPPANRSGGRFFTQTGHSLRGSFLSFWTQNGGLDRFGYPLTEELIEPQPGSGKPRVVQYFERARFEYFPELAGTPYDVQLGHLGTGILTRFGIDWQQLPKVGEAPPECQFFPETGHSLCPPFLERWQALGGLPLLGLPISEPFDTPRPGGGARYTVQYFERARMEYFLEYIGTPYEVQFGLLGRETLTFGTP